MRKTLIYAAMAFAALGFTACSSDDDITKGGNGKAGDPQYVSIDVRNVVATPSSKAIDYASADENESKLGKVRFYFFYSNGDPFDMTNSNVGTANPPSTANVNYVDHDFSSEAQDTYDGNPADETVERRTKAILVLNGVQNGSPAQVVAVANPEQAGLDNTSKKLDELEAASLLTKNYAADDATNFVMSSSVYSSAETNGTKMCAASTDGKIKTTPQAATGDPVRIYIERVAAKVTTDKSGAEWTTVNIDGTDYDAFKLSQTVPYNQITVTDGNVSQSQGTPVEVYAAVMGWGLADEQTEASLFKNISGFGSWTTDALVGTESGPWTTPNYFRCFWETTPSLTATNIKSQSWKSYATTNQMKFGNNTRAYTMPNTPATGTTIENANRNPNFTNLTKVLVACKLVDADGNEQEICEDLSSGNNYIGINNFKNVILNRIKGTIYKSLDNGATKDGLTVDDIDFVENTDADVTHAGNKDYQVSTVLKTDANAKYYSSNADDAVEMTAEQLAAFNTSLQDYKAVIYKNGMTYYYTTIQHLAATARPETTLYNDETWLTTNRSLGWFGVVRNHWYKVGITGFHGLGTAVYNPDRYIRPVTPTKNLSYMAAEINVLQWRVVEQNVDIDGSGRNN